MRIWFHIIVNLAYQKFKRPLNKFKLNLSCYIRLHAIKKRKPQFHAPLFSESILAATSVSVLHTHYAIYLWKSWQNWIKNKVFSSDIYLVFLLLISTKGADGATSDWVKLNTINQHVCFETKGGVFGSFDNYVKGGLIAAIKLVHLSGRVRCASHAKYNSRWGCTGLPSLPDNPLNVFVTDQYNRIIFPRKELIVP